MTDVVDRDTRSRIMSKIRSRDTHPELMVRSMLHRSGLRFRVNDRGLPGRPDVVLKRWNAAVFVNGCFWHRHPRCRYASMPSSNVAFWRTKFRQNVLRDRRSQKALVDAGWRVFVVWECEVTDARIRQLARSIKRGSHGASSR